MPQVVLLATFTILQLPAELQRNTVQVLFVDGLPVQLLPEAKLTAAQDPAPLHWNDWHVVTVQICKISN